MDWNKDSEVISSDNLPSANGILGSLAFVFIASLVFTPIVSAFPSHALSNLAYDSTVQIEVRFKDRRDADIKHAEVIKGHGVYITERGTIFSASHVVFPSLADFENAGAASYQLVIREFRDGHFSDSVWINAEDLTTIVAHGNIPLSSCPASNEGIRCLTGKASAGEDWIFLSTKSHRPTDPPAFVGIVGVYDDLYADIKHQGVELSVIAEFVTGRGLRKASISQPPPMAKTDRFETDVLYEFSEGISGAPVFISSQSPMPSVFVAGAVVRELNLSDDGQRNEFRSALIKNIDKRMLLGFISRERIGEPVKCRHSAFPYPRPLLKSYIFTIKFRERLAEQHQITECMTNHIGWIGTARIIEYRISHPEDAPVEAVTSRSIPWREPFECTTTQSGSLRCTEGSSSPERVASQQALHRLFLKTNEAGLDAESILTDYGLAAEASGTPTSSAYYQLAAAVGNLKNSATKGKGVNFHEFTSPLSETLALASGVKPIYSVHVSDASNWERTRYESAEIAPDWWTWLKKKYDPLVSIPFASGGDPPVSSPRPPPRLPPPTRLDAPTLPPPPTRPPPLTRPFPPGYTADK